MSNANESSDDSRSASLRLWVSSFLAWGVITITLTVYVATNYSRGPIDWAAVFLKQAISWMPFAPVLPLLRSIALRVPESRGRVASSLLWFAVGVGVLIAYTLIRSFAFRQLLHWSDDPDFDPVDYYFADLAVIWPYAVIVYVTLLAMAFGRIARDSRSHAEQISRRLEAELAQAQLLALQAQIRPHFLFNALQAIEDACWRDPKDASSMIIELGALLRVSLEGERQDHTLAHDLDLARRYMGLQRARFGDRLRYTENVDADATSVPMPPLFLQPLLENAVAHGIERLEAGGEVRVTARRDGGELVLLVENDAPSGAAAGGERDGVGLANTRARLRSLHGAGATLELRERRGSSGVEVEARVPLRETA